MPRRSASSTCSRASWKSLLLDPLAPRAGQLVLVEDPELHGVSPGVGSGDSSTLTACVHPGPSGYAPAAPIGEAHVPAHPPDDQPPRRPCHRHHRRRARFRQAGLGEDRGTRREDRRLGRRGEGARRARRGHPRQRRRRHGEDRGRHPSRRAPGGRRPRGRDLRRDRHHAEQRRRDAPRLLRRPRGCGRCLGPLYRHQSEGRAERDLRRARPDDRAGARPHRERVLHLRQSAGGGRGGLRRHQGRRGLPLRGPAPGVPGEDQGDDDPPRPVSPPRTSATA